MEDGSFHRLSSGRVDEEVVVDDEDLALSGSPKKRQKKKKMAFPRSSILKIKVPKKKKRTDESDQSGGSASSDGSSNSKWSWMSPSARRKKRKRKKSQMAAKKRIIGGGNSGVGDYSSGSTVLTKTIEATEDAWMCGLCGMAFSSHEHAEAHEVRCVRYAFGTNDRGDVRMMESSGELVFSSTQNVGAPHASAQPQPNSIFHASFSAALGPTRPLTDRAAAFGLFPSSQDNGVIGKTPASSDGAETRYEIRSAKTSRGEPGAVHLSESMRRCVVMTDEAVCKVALRASAMVLSFAETDAERELALLARDRAYYDVLATRSEKRHSAKGRSKFFSSSDGEGGVMGEIKSRFADAYKLIKAEETEGGLGSGGVVDVYSAKGNKGKAMPEIGHDDGTLYINVIVKNGAQVISHELERLAKMRWEQEQVTETDRMASKAALDVTAGVSVPRKEFEWFRHFAQYNMVRLAGLALASDFTPRRIAVQLSNDLYRLMAPRLKKKGVSIETELEYRVGAYFVLGVNINAVDWVVLMKYTHKEVEDRKRRWREEKKRHQSVEAEDGKDGDSDGKEAKKADKGKGRRIMYRLYIPTLLELIAQCLAWLHRVHWIISIPTCHIWYFLLSNKMRQYILASTTDEIFQYVERKGMEMEMEVCEAWKQASFMLSVLRELRADEKELKKKKAEAESGEAGGVVLGPLLGPAIKEDKGAASPPAGWTPPDNLEDVNLEMDLPVGFRRLRWALLNKDSTFQVEAVWKVERQYENIVVGDWSEHKEHIGLPTLPADVKAESFIDVFKESEYLMPKSAFVKANMCYEKCSIVEYNDHCFAFHGTARTPEVPYGNTFFCHTRVVITNKGNNRCGMVCSVEAEFPNGPPMVGRQIKSGMRAGTAESFVALGETICRYAEEYP
uniref:VASt domain-containing protein n=1 Tax=Pseudictyota dubia TaxID=2749911 RepID=A0A7R9W4M1_9STRA